MKPILITLATSTALVLGAVTLTPKTTEPPLIIPTEPKKVVISPQKVAQFFTDCGINGSEHALVRDMLLNEEPQTIDLSTTDLKATVEDHMKCLSNEEMVNAYQQGKRSINELLINKANNVDTFVID